MRVMDLKQELIDRLGVPENWDKYDYQTQRYSFDDVHEVLGDIVKKLTIPDVVGQSEQLKAVQKLKDFAYEVCPLHREDDLEEIVGSL